MTANISKLINKNNFIIFPICIFSPYNESLHLKNLKIYYLNNTNNVVVILIGAY